MFKLFIAFRTNVGLKIRTVCGNVAKGDFDVLKTRMRLKYLL